MEEKNIYLTISIVALIVGVLVIALLHKTTTENEYLKGLNLSKELCEKLEPKIIEHNTTTIKEVYIQNNTAYLDLLNKCIIAEPDKQYLIFNSSVNVTALLNPKCPVSHGSTKYITEYIICEECPVLQRCPANQVMQCLSTNDCECQTDCSCVAKNIN